MDLVCYSHLRWNFVYQRPQHIMSRMANYFRVFYIEEAVLDSDLPYWETFVNEQQVRVVVPHLPPGREGPDLDAAMAELLLSLFVHFEIEKFVAWYYTPMALNYVRGNSPELIVYDCMDELSAFRHAASSMIDMEAQLLNKADVVFTGGRSLFEAKRHRHHNIHLFPSSIDIKHFQRARDFSYEMNDQAQIARPRIGFFGVIDERMDVELLGAIAERRPEWNFVIIGPVVKIDPSVLPGFHNIFYLGSKLYDQLPLYISTWDVAIMPFALNASTQYISPTKTPEYLAAGLPVVSTPVADVIAEYAERGLVHIARDPDSFVEQIELAMLEKNEHWLQKVDACLGLNSWDDTVAQMHRHLAILFENQKATMQTSGEENYV